MKKQLVEILRKTLDTLYKSIYKLSNENQKPLIYANFFVLFFMELVDVCK